MMRQNYDPIRPNINETWKSMQLSIPVVDLRSNGSSPLHVARKQSCGIDQ